MASLLLRSAARVLRRSLPQGPFRRSPAQQFVDNPRLFSCGGVNKSCTLEKGLPRQRIDNHLDSIEANVAANLRAQRATTEQLEVILQKKIENTEQLEVILQKKIENEIADKKHNKVVLGAFAFLGLTLFAYESLFGGVKKEKCQAVKPPI